MKTYTWYLCRSCTDKVVDDLQDHERLIIKNPAYAYGECSVCYGLLSRKVTVQQNTHEWLQKFTFNKQQTVEASCQEDSKK